MIPGNAARAGVREALGGGLAGLAVLAAGVLVASSTRLPVESALLVGAVGCAGRGLWGQVGALAVAMAAGLTLGGHAAGPLAAALAAGWLAAFGEFARCEAWGFGHLRGAGRFLGAAALVLLGCQWLGWTARGPLVAPVLGAAGFVLLSIVAVEFARNVRAARRAGRPARRRRTGPITT